MNTWNKRKIYLFLQQAIATEKAADFNWSNILQNTPTVVLLLFVIFGITFNRLKTIFLNFAGILAVIAPIYDSKEIYRRRKNKLNQATSIQVAVAELKD